MNRKMKQAFYDTAELAVDIAFEKASSQLRTLKGGKNSFYPKVDLENKQVGIGINNKYYYLIYQNNGFASYPMKSLYGKTIPMLLPNGQLIFRKCTSVNQFRPGHKYYWQRDANGELVPEYRQKRSWVHPGLPPKNFLEQAIDEAIATNSHLFASASLYDDNDDNIIKVLIDKFFDKIKTLLW